MRTLGCLLALAVLLSGCSEYKDGKCDQAEVCDGVDNNCDGLTDRTAFECPDGSIIKDCECDADGKMVCLEHPEEQCRDDHCDDGTTPSCRMQPPECEAHEILAYQDACYVCVNPITCRPWGEPGCSSDADCVPSELCDPCASSSCPACDDCVAGCLAHGCETEDEALCDMVRPDCGASRVSVVRDGCWTCVDAETCEEGRDTSCDDGTDPVCPMPQPDCEDHELLAIQDGCFACVNPRTCRPWGEPGCAVDADCEAVDFCNDCGTSSCPDCLDCVPACTPHGCETETQAACFMERPQCGANQVAVIRNACWRCVDLTTCEPGRDARCDDGAPLDCRLPQPDCQDWEIAAIQDGCWVCVNPDTCIPWGVPGCHHDADCRSADFCDPCGTSSCPMCDDCVAACRPHGCETEPEPLCDAPRPACDPGQVAVVRDGCWVCVALDTCEPTGRDTHCDDGTEPLCDMPEPVCQEWEILAYQDYCYACVNPETCKPWGEPGCAEDFDCLPDAWCNPCGSASCPDCDDCVAACTAHGCPTEKDLMCWCARPDCGQGAVSVIEDGCWICVTMDACTPTGEGC